MKITNQILKENRFELKRGETPEYNYTIFEDRWYYGPYIYLLKDIVSDSPYWHLFVDKDKYEDWIGHTVSNFDETYEGIDEIRTICKEFYADLNRKLKKQIEELESEREEIMNYVF